MPTDQVRIRSLYAGLNRTIIWFGLLAAAAWLFAIFSYYLSSKAGTDFPYPTTAVRTTKAAPIITTREIKVAMKDMGSPRPDRWSRKPRRPVLPENHIRT